MTLSVALAVHNEENNIERCLRSVYDWVDEIVLVDGASTDKTVEIAKKLDTKNRIKIFALSNPAMFHSNKQKALEKCTGDWILQLDADEVVSTELKREILSVLSTQYSVKNRNKTENRVPRTENQPIAFWLPRLNYFLGSPLRKGGQYPDHTIRLYRNDVAHFPCKTVHEQVEISTRYSVLNTQQNRTENRELKTENRQIGYLNANLLHFPYPSFSSYLMKWKRYNTLEASELKKKHISPYSPITFVNYVFIKPPLWFFKTYFRHLGIVDGWSGFVFSFFSSIRYVAIYLTLLTGKKA